MMAVTRKAFYYYKKLEDTNGVPLTSLPAPTTWDGAPHKCPLSRAHSIIQCMLTCAIPMTSYVMVTHLRYMPCCRKSTLLCVRAPKTHTLRKKSTDERSRWQSGSAARCERRRQSTLHQHASKLCDGSTQTILHPTMVRICFCLSHRWYRDFFSCVLGAC